MQKIIVKADVLSYLDTLVQVLLDKDYFAFEHTSLEYVNTILDFIYNNLHQSRHCSSPQTLKKYGEYYSVYKANKRTQWYVFFNKKNNRYIIKFVTNNHVAKAGFLSHL